ncbi:MAG: carboxypeptidase regulatory-like domain-containing protein, partial [Candidatus Acidiferrales bacterium]
MKSMTILRIGVCVCLSLLLGGATFAQTTGTIRGSVKDPSGAVVPGANLRATLQGTDTTRTASSDADGDFEFPELAVGHYTVTVEATGFKKFNVKDIEVSLGHVTAVNAALQVGESAQTVTVESEAAQVETTSTQMGAVVNDIAIRQLPLNKRDTYQLLQLQPGVQSQLGANLFYGSDQAGVVSVNGGRGRSNNYMVNGGDGNDIFVNLPAIQPSPDAIEEFRVLTNTFDAEYGRNSGSVVNVVTKSGTNEIHGDFYDFFRNKVLDARNPFDSTVADWKQNQFGATLGAPIKKDRTFIFGSYEGNRQIEGQSSGNVFVPTSQEAAGNFSAAGSTFTGTLSNAFFAGIIGARTTGNTGQNCDSAARKEQAAAGLPPTGVTNAAGGLFQNIFPNNKIPIECFDPVALDLYNQFVAPLPNSGSGTVSLNPGEHDRGDQFTIRFDHKISATQQFSAYYYFTDNSKTEPFSFFQAAGANVPGFGALFATRVQQWNLSHTWTIGSSAVNEFRFSYFREGQGKLDHPAFVSSDGTAHSACKTVSAAFCFSDPANLAAGITTRLPGHAGVPFISVSGGFVIGNNFEGELPQVGNTFQWMDNYTKIIGKHSFKFGGDVHRQRFDQFLFFETTGFFTFQSNQASPSGNDVGFSDAYPNYFLGQPTSY